MPILNSAMAAVSIVLEACGVVAPTQTLTTSGEVENPNSALNI